MSSETHYEAMRRLIDPHLPWARSQTERLGLMGLKTKMSLGRYMAYQWALFEEMVPNTATIEEALLDESSDTARILYEFVYRELSKGDANALFCEIWQQRQHLCEGQKVYEVSPGLAEQLKYTTFENIKVDALFLPFRSIYIHVPHNSGLSYLPQFAGKLEENRVPVVGIYITEIKTRPEAGWMRVGTDTTFEKVTKPELDKARIYRVWRVLVVGEEKQRPDFIKEDARDFTTFSFDIFLPEGWDIERIVALKGKEVAALPEDLKVIYEAEDGIAPVWEDIVRWIFNVMAYATMLDADKTEGWENKEARDLLSRIKKLPPGNKKEKLKDRLRVLDPRYRIYLGQGMTRLNVAERMSGLSVEGRKLAWRLLVSGHWKHQAYGPNLSQRKLIWVRPYWKGPIDAEELHSKHALIGVHDDLST